MSGAGSDVEGAAGCVRSASQLSVGSLGNFGFGHCRSTSGFGLSDAGTPSMRGSLDREDLHGKYLACDRSGATVTRVIMLPGEAGDGPVTRLLTVSDSTLMRLGGRPVDSKEARGNALSAPGGGALVYGARDSPMCGC